MFTTDDRDTVLDSLKGPRNRGIIPNSREIEYSLAVSIVWKEIRWGREFTALKPTSLVVDCTGKIISLEGEKKAVAKALFALQEDEGVLCLVVNEPGKKHPFDFLFSDLSPETRRWIEVTGESRNTVGESWTRRGDLIQIKLYKERESLKLLNGHHLFKDNKKERLYKPGQLQEHLNNVTRDLAGKLGYCGIPARTKIAGALQQRLELPVPIEVHRAAEVPIMAALKFGKLTNITQQDLSSAHLQSYTTMPDPLNWEKINISSFEELIHLNETDCVVGGDVSVTYSVDSEEAVPRLAQKVEGIVYRCIVDEHFSEDVDPTALLCAYQYSQTRITRCKGFALIATDPAPNRSLKELSKKLIELKSDPVLGGAARSIAIVFNGKFDAIHGSEYVKQSNGQIVATGYEEGRNRVPQIYQYVLGHQNNAIYSTLVGRAAVDRRETGTQFAIDAAESKDLGIEDLEGPHTRKIAPQIITLNSNLRAEEGRDWSWVLWKGNIWIEFPLVKTPFEGDWCGYFIVGAQTMAALGSRSRITDKVPAKEWVEREVPSKAKRLYE